MTPAVLAEATRNEQVWVRLPGVRVVNLSRSGIDSSVVEWLRHRLELGTAVEVDPRRPRFYVASINEYCYYFHILPNGDNGFKTGRPAKVYLLARWKAD